MISAVLEYKYLIDDAYSCYIDSFLGYTKLLDTINKSQQEDIARLKDKEQEKENLLFLDTQEMRYSSGGVGLTRGTTANFKSRNSLDGSNKQWIARMFIVTIYELWESEYRRKIGKQKGLTSGKIKCPIMGDLRRMRHWIIHQKSIPDEKVKKMEEIKWCSKGELLQFYFNKIQEIVNKLTKSLEYI